MPRRVPEARSVSSSVAPRARAARVAATEEEKNGPGRGMRPISSSTTHISSRPAPLPPYSSGTSRPVHPRSASVDHSDGSDAIGLVGQLAHHVRPALALQGAACHLLQCELLVVVREVHGLPYVSLTDAPFPDTGVRVHGGRVPFPRGFCPCTGGREVPRRVARLARRAAAPLPGGGSPGRRRQPLGRGEPATSPEVAAQAARGRLGGHPLGPRLRPGPHHQRHAAPPLLRGDGRVPHAGHVQHERDLADRAR